MVLACRNSSRGNALKAELEAAAKAAGSATPLLEVRMFLLLNCCRHFLFAPKHVVKAGQRYVLCVEAAVLIVMPFRLVSR